mgnify:CR=1 FL=1
MSNGKAVKKTAKNSEGNMKGKATTKAEQTAVAQARPPEEQVQYVRCCSRSSFLI